MIDLCPLGDRAWLARFGAEEEALAWAGAVRSAGWEGVVDVVAAYRSVGVYLDPARVDPATLGDRLRGLAVPDPASAAAGRLHRIPVRYDGPDLEKVAGRLGLSPAAVVREHAGAEYRVHAVGFTPGFPYAGYLPGPLSGLPRLEVPRQRVEAGSVALAGRQTGIYPRPSPGGWHLIGRTPLVIADPDSGYFPIRPGDRLRFDPISTARFAELAGARLAENALDPGRPA